MWRTLSIFALLLVLDEVECTWFLFLLLARVCCARNLVRILEGKLLRGCALGPCFCCSTAVGEKDARGWAPAPDNGGKIDVWQVSVCSMHSPSVLSVPFSGGTSPPATSLLQLTEMILRDRLSLFPGRNWEQSAVATNTAAVFPFHSRAPPRATS